MTHTPRMPISAWAGFQGQEPLALLQPDEVILVDSLSSVLSALERVEAAVQRGATALGMLSYEAASAFEPAMVTHPPAEGFPLVWFAVCHKGGRGQIRRGDWEAVSRESDDVKPSSSPSASSSSYAVSEWVPNVSRDEYNARIGSIKEAIREGNTYQVNYTMRLHASIEGNHASLFSSLLRAQRCGYGTYLDTGRHRILSASPELFFRWRQRDGTICTRPMKGTAPRGYSAADDEAVRAELAASDKNRAENLMIVDLLRNDLGRIAVKGSVRVPALFDIERYPTVFQMTSTVAAVTKPATRLVDVLKALFPCGSITGAPKLSTMRIIAGLETAPRGVYCGAICLVTPEPVEDGGGDVTDGGPSHTLCVTASVPIRTVVIDTQQSSDVTGAAGAEYGVGGGVTWDSTPDGEYEETLDKAKVLRVASRAGGGGGGGCSTAAVFAVDPRTASCSLGEAMRGPEFKLLETLRLDYHLTTSSDCDAGPAPRYFLLRHHLARLSASARYFGYRCDESAVIAALDAHAKQYAVAACVGTDGVQSRRVRLLLARDGGLAVESTPVNQPLSLPDDLPLSAAAAMMSLMGGASVDDGGKGLTASVGGAASSPTSATSSMMTIASHSADPLPLAKPSPSPPPPPQRVVLSPIPVSRRNVFLYHKTTRREVYAAHVEAVKAALKKEGKQSDSSDDELLDVLLWSEERASASHANDNKNNDNHRNDDGNASPSSRFVTEFTIGSVVVEDPDGGGLLTPPVAHGCLPGTLRQAVIEAGVVREAPVTVAQLLAARRVWLLNSVRGWVRVRVQVEP